MILLRNTSISAARATSSRHSRKTPRMPIRSIWQAIRTAKEKQSPGIWPSSSALTRPLTAASSSMRSRSRPSRKPSSIRAASILTRSMPSRHGACSTASSAINCRRSSGARCARACRPAACSP